MTTEIREAGMFFEKDRGLCFIQVLITVEDQDYTVLAPVLANSSLSEILPYSDPIPPSGEIRFDFPEMVLPKMPIAWRIKGELAGHSICVASGQLPNYPTIKKTIGLGEDRLELEILHLPTSRPKSNFRSALKGATEELYEL